MSMTLALFFLVVVTSLLSALSMLVFYWTNLKWMRIFSEKQGIPATTMEVRPKAPEAVTPTVKLKTKAFSMPVPGADLLRDMYKAKQ